MFKSLSSDMHHGFILMKWRQTQWMLLYFMVSGTYSLITVHQPPLLTAAQGHDVIMPCQLNLSNNEKMVSPPVLYWIYNSKMYVLSDTKYAGRAHPLDNNTDASNKSFLLKDVQWTDSGKYLCKLSISTEGKSFRERGNETLLIVYDTMLFNLIGHNDSQLQCKINVTRDPRMVLSIIHNGCKVQTAEKAVTALPYVTLSETISLKDGGKYECQLHLDKNLITKSTFHWHPHEPDVVVCPQPWFLYAALLLVPTTVLLVLVIAVIYRKLSTSGWNRDA
ncbi:hypothetical protein PAMA_015489 [Pampus argenteus]